MTVTSQYGFPESLCAQCPPGTLPARISAVHKELYQVICDHGFAPARLKGRLFYELDLAQALPTVGDYVAILYDPSGDSSIVRVFDRRTCLVRSNPTPGKGPQALCANIDISLLATSCNHDFNPARLERYLSAVWQSGAMPVIVLTKADLVQSVLPFVSAIEARIPGVDCIALSAHTREGMDALLAYLAPGKTVALLGTSGVGKSSLVNALCPSAQMEVSAIREDDSRGRHTTTHRQLLLLSGGALIIDTPGMRSFGLIDSQDGFDTLFEDIDTLTHACRFANCRHQNEPGCAIRAALEDGTLTKERWVGYQKLQREAAYASDKAQYMRERSAWHKKIATTMRTQPPKNRS